jgi:hypothetical protein
MSLSSAKKKNTSNQADLSAFFISGKLKIDSFGMPNKQHFDKRRGKNTDRLNYCDFAVSLKKHSEQ